MGRGGGRACASGCQGSDRVDEASTIIRIDNTKEAVHGVAVVTVNSRVGGTFTGTGRVQTPAQAQETVTFHGAINGDLGGTDRIDGVGWNKDW